MTLVVAPVAGEVIALDDVDDEVFSERIVGDGVAVRPTGSQVRAPIAGRVEKLFPGGHGVAIESADGLQVLVHIGLETVKLEGDGFTTLVEEGADVAVGDLLVTVDLDRLAELGIDTVTPVVVISGHAVTVVGRGTVAAGDALLESG
ncbi:MAG: PTS glucose transporter subunit IIA [Nitriliruptor sp.]|uniref:PTS glucose transporter subunit IIA n=1 Tax=Nitriliruptor sp. TaxID=2448056 RepID=UPI0034A00A19